MGINIDSFRYGLKNGLQRANRYRVAITEAKGVPIPGGDIIDLTADAVSLPGRNISTQEYSSGRESHKNPYTFIDSDVSITFLMTNDFEVRKFFDAWMKKVIDTDNYTVGYKNEYAGTVTIQAMNYKGVRTGEGKVSDATTPVYGTKLLQAFPINIGAIEYSNASENTVATMQVTFAYDRYEVI